MTDDVQVQFGANVDQLNAAMEKLVSTVRSAADGMQAAGATGAAALSNSLSALQSRITSVTQANTAATTAIQQQINALVGYGNEAKSAAASASVFEDSLGITAAKARALSDQLKKLNPDLDGTRNSAGGVAHGAAGITREFIVLGHEVVSGNFSRIPGSMMVLAERTGGLLTVISSLSATTLAGAAAMGAFAVALGVVEAHAISAAKAVEATRGAMMVVGTLGESSTSQIEGWIDRLRDHWNASRTEAQKSAEALGSLGGPAAQFAARIMDAAAAEATLKHTDLDKSVEALVKAFNGGADSAIRWAQQNHVVGESFQATGTETEKMNAVLEAMEKRFVSGGNAVADARKQMQLYQNVVAQMAESGATPESIGITMPSNKDLQADPSKGTQQNAAEDEQNAIIRKTNAAEEERAKILTNIWEVQQAIDRLDANPDAKAAAEAAQADRAFNTSITGIIQGTETGSQAAKKAASSIAVSYMESSAKMATKWIADRLAELATGKAVEVSKSAATAAGTAQREMTSRTEGSGQFSAISELLARWTGMETGKTAATEAGNTIRTASNLAADKVSAASTETTASSGIMQHAGSAAAAVYDDVSQIPYVGWILAPIAAGAAFTAVAAYSEFSSAEGGWGQVPADGMQTILHKNEMVLPAKFADPLRRNLLGGGMWGANTGQGGGGATSTSGGQRSSGGDIHLHYGPTISGSGQSVSSLKSMLQQSGQDLITWLRNEKRNGTFSV
ncbi:hypothetical protein GCM10011611_38940 [Aliidongia dinghuensis]|uniref:Bacteriophage tail tape measure N-terminal domain-containing protein n=1 Tax=Aliidongia dinghuensis TaxID=1867774 RepID=A0A8J2YVV8_9PROT|nr:hypothetical protein [Aliidongia dinghuensis]GGF29078.1 hypothetical protein GCM10011611_38940 [Aliidongia dinghuensis]